MLDSNIVSNTNQELHYTASQSRYRRNRRRNFRRVQQRFRRNAVLNNQVFTSQQANERLGQLMKYQPNSMYMSSAMNIFVGEINTIRLNIKPITVVAGSSIAKRLNVRNLQIPSEQVRLSAESGCDCRKMVEWLRTFEGYTFMQGAYRLILILGTNDLHKVGARLTINNIRDTVFFIQQSFPGVIIVWQLLQRRQKTTLLLPAGQAVSDEVQLCNRMLIELSKQLNFEWIQPDLPWSEISSDKLHPTAQGTRRMERTIRSYLNARPLSLYSFS